MNAMVLERIAVQIRVQRHVTREIGVALLEVEVLPDERVALLVGKNVPSLDWPGLRISGARACALIATATPPGRPSTPGLTHFQRRRWYLLLEDDY